MTCPYLMNDGREFTNYKTNCIIYHDLRVKNQLPYNQNNIRHYMQTNARKIALDNIKAIPEPCQKLVFYDIRDVNNFKHPFL